MMAQGPEPSPLMRLPTEIRLMIYNLLLDDNGNKIFFIRTLPPAEYKTRVEMHRRTGYRILAGVFLRQSLPTTYHLESNANLHTNILAVNRKIYSETVSMLYGMHSFDFGNDIEAIVPFLSDLTPQTRPLIHSISLMKKAYPHTRDFDRCEWRSVCLFLSHSMKLQKLTLRVAGGRSPSGWDGLQEYTAGDFKALASVRFDGIEWAEELSSVKVGELEIIPEIEHCPPPMSTAMMFFQAFSASIDNGFTEYLRGKMLTA